MKSRKIPKVKIVIGIVNIIKIGLKNTFNKAITIATRIAVGKFVISTPGSNQAAKKIDKDEMIILTMVCIRFLIKINKNLSNLNVCLVSNLGA